MSDLTDMPSADQKYVESASLLRECRDVVAVAKEWKLRVPLNPAQPGHMSSK